MRINKADCSRYVSYANKTFNMIRPLNLLEEKKGSLRNPQDKMCPGFVWVKGSQTVHRQDNIFLVLHYYWCQIWSVSLLTTKSVILSFSGFCLA